MHATKKNFWAQKVIPDALFHPEEDKKGPVISFSLSPLLLLAGV